MAQGQSWKKLPLALSELCIDTSLRCGQSFRWQKIDGDWYGQFKRLPLPLLYIESPQAEHASAYLISPMPSASRILNRGLTFQALVYSQ